MATERKEVVGSDAQAALNRAVLRVVELEKELRAARVLERNLRAEAARQLAL